MEKTQENYPNLISAEIIKGSKNQFGEKIVTFKLVMPRFILAEFNTHRLFSRNSASSRAIPFRKMVKSVLDTPFIPIAFQKDHTGMQGFEYLDNSQEYSLPEILSVLSNVFKYKDDLEIDKHIFRLLEEIYESNEDVSATLQEWWSYCSKKVTKSAILMASLGVTKQIANRILEPFMYHTVLVTATEWENFFELRCPKYRTPVTQLIEPQRSWKDLINAHGNEINIKLLEENRNNIIFKLQHNEGAGEIHIMDLAEKMWDAYNEYEFEELKEGEWHIPFNIKGDESKFPLYKQKIWENKQAPTNGHIELAIKVATARCARISYETLGDSPVIDYEKDIKLHDDLLSMGHMSPFEHCAKVMNNEEYYSHIKSIKGDGFTVSDEKDIYLDTVIGIEDAGWSRNFKGFQQYREIIE